MDFWSIFLDRINVPLSLSYSRSCFGQEKEEKEKKKKKKEEQEERRKKKGRKGRKKAGKISSSLPLFE